MGQLLQEIELRKSRRALSEQPVPDDTVRRIMLAATYTASCSNNQPWRFVVITEPEELAKAKAALSGGNYWAKMAPLIILVTTKDDLDCQLSDSRNLAQFDVGMAAENLILQSVAEGLIAHPIAGYNPELIRKSFEIPAEYALITLIVVGFPGDESHLSEKHLAQEHGERSRQHESKVISYNRWFE